MTTATVLRPGDVSLATLQQTWSAAVPVRIDAQAREAIRQSAARVATAAAQIEPVYGVNTGFGKLASIRIAPSEVTQLQRNLVLSHCCGVGEPMPEAVVRLMMVLKLVSLGRGASGVRECVIDCLEQCLARDILPVIPCQGSVGASGDLAPLAHMAAALIGEGEVIMDGQRQPAATALASAGIAYALAGWFRACHAAAMSTLTACLSIDAAKASTAPLIDEIHILRGHPGQIRVASTMRRLLDGSEIRAAHKFDDTRVQDPYCLRCHPQVVGAAEDMLTMAGRTLQREANAATDNPLVMSHSDRIVSGGNFHAEPVAFAADMIALALAEIGAISQRRVALLVDPTLSCDLPPFLARDPGLNSGLMIAEVTSAALMSENKHLANPCSTDSTPTSANQEDHVSMAAHGARRLIPMADNLCHILGIELLCASEGIRCRAPLKTSRSLQAVLTRIEQDIAPIEQDRLLAPTLNSACQLVCSNELLRLAGISPVPGLESVS